MAARVLPGFSLHNLGSSDKQREVPLAAKPQHTRSPHLLYSLTLALPATVSPLCYTGPFKPVHRNLCSPIHPRSTGFPLAFWAPPSVPPTMPLDQYSSHLPPECSSSLPAVCCAPWLSASRGPCGALALLSRLKVPSSWF